MPRAATQRWKMRNGRVINVRDMDDGHLQNTYAMMQRNLAKCRQAELDRPEDWEELGRRGDWTQEWVDVLGQELSYRGLIVPRTA